MGYHHSGSQPKYLCLKVINVTLRAIIAPQHQATVTLSDFDYELPEGRIAQYPLEKRSDSRLMVINKEKGAMTHHHFYHLPQFLKAGDLLVFNDSKVIPARLFATKATGGKVEILIERILNEHEVLAHVRAKHLKVGAELYVTAQDRFVVIARDSLVHLGWKGEQPLQNMLDQHGHIPLPPYIERADEASDVERYQTIYAKEKGSVAAPTAGLHFDEELLNTLREKGIRFAYVTLHVGAGTFQPVKTERIEDHVMHGELISLPEETVKAIKATRSAGGRVIAVGTTAARTLESVPLRPFFGETHLFIYPGFQFQVVDGLITNFHLPKSSLLMLVAALMGLPLMKQAYALAIQEEYRFFSFGDAMLII